MVLRRLRRRTQPSFLDSCYGLRAHSFSSGQLAHALAVDDDLFAPPAQGLEGRLQGGCELLEGLPALQRGFQCAANV